MQEYSICKLEKRLDTAHDIASARRCCCLGGAFISEGLNETFHRVSGGLPRILVSVLSDSFQVWRKFYQRVTADGKSTGAGAPRSSIQHLFYKPEEVNRLQRALNLIAKVSQLDSILGEEIGRAGSQSILSQLFEQIKVCLCIVESNGSYEEDLDALMDLQDTACEIYFPGIRGAMAFTDEELARRLPLVYNLRPVLHDQTEVGGSTTILIHQVTKRQTAQADVGYLMWPSAIVLSRWLLTNAHVLNGKTILEIGAGCGLVGILAATIVKNSDWNMPNQVIISDVNNTVLDNISQNINLNDVSSVASVAKLDFYHQTGDNHAGMWVAEAFRESNERCCEPVSVILAADIICQPEDAVAAAKTIYDGKM